MYVKEGLTYNSRNSRLWCRVSRENGSLESGHGLCIVGELYVYYLITRVINQLINVRRSSVPIRRVINTFFRLITKGSRTRGLQKKKKTAQTYL